MALYWPVPGTWSCPSGTDLLQHLCRRQDNFLLRKKGKHGYFLLFTPPCVDSFYIAGDFSTNDKMIPQSIPLKHKRFIIREWRPPTWDLSQEGIWKGNRHGANQTPHEERKMCDNKNSIHWHTPAQTVAPWGFFTRIIVRTNIILETSSWLVLK